MEYRILIQYDNDAFGEEPGREVARILRDLAETCETLGLQETEVLTDINGNDVGYALRFDKEAP